MDAASYEPYLSLSVALLVGLLIGIEREQSAPDDIKERRREFLGGVRTYPLVALTGALSRAPFGTLRLVFGRSRARDPLRVPPDGVLRGDAP